MKKWLVRTAAVFAVSFLLLPQSAEAQELAQGAAYVDTVIVNGQALTPEVRPFIIDGQTFVPLRWAFAQLGVKDLIWTPENTASAKAVITTKIPEYLQLMEYESLLRGLSVSRADLKGELPPQLHRIAFAGNVLEHKTSKINEQPPLIIDTGDARAAIGDYLLLNNQYYIGVRWLNTLLGAQITFDQGILTINGQSRNYWQKQLDELYQQLGCSSADEAVNLWIRAMEKQSAALQYALVNQNLKDTIKANVLKQQSWSLNTSRTLAHGKITAKDSDGKSRMIYDLEFTEMIGGQPNMSLRQRLIVEKSAFNWQITAVSGDTDDFTLLSD